MANTLCAIAGVDDDPLLQLEFFKACGRHAIDQTVLVTATTVDMVAKCHHDHVWFVCVVTVDVEQPPCDSESLSL